MAKQVRIRGVQELARKLERHGQDVQAGLEAITDAAARVVQERAAINAGGDVGDSIMRETTERQARRVVVAVGPDRAHWYARFREFGAGPHTIRPSQAQALRFAGRFAAVVRHPGVAARPFLRPAADEGQDEALQAAGNEMKKLLG